MTKQLSDLFDDFLSMPPDEQSEKIRSIRHARTIERPVAARKRQKKQISKDNKMKTSVKALLRGMSDEDKQALRDAIAKRALEKK